jgi:hypothetical protein
MGEIIFFINFEIHFIDYTVLIYDNIPRFHNSNKFELLRLDNELSDNNFGFDILKYNSIIK